jgi:hypothetical protein
VIVEAAVVFAEPVPETAPASGLAPPDVAGAHPEPVVRRRRFPIDVDVGLGPLGR